MASYELNGKLASLKNQYYELIEARIRKSKTPSLSKQVVMDLIKGLLSWKSLPENKNKDWYLDKYAIKVKNNRYMLNMRQEDNKVLIVVPWEDSFAFVWAAHVNTQHGSLLETRREIMTKYIVESACVDILTDICYCNTYKCVNVSVVELSEAVHDYFSHILVYEDCHTGYVQLKPIHDNIVPDISLELIKIFCDTGVPSLIKFKMPTINLDELLNYLNKLWPYDSISVVVSNGEDTSTIFKIIVMITEWVNQLPKPGKTYYYGWHVVQHKYNNMKDEGELSPFEKAFPYLRKTRNPSAYHKDILQSEDDSEAAAAKEILEAISDDDLYYDIEIETNDHSAASLDTVRTGILITNVRSEVITMDKHNNIAENETETIIHDNTTATHSREQHESDNVIDITENVEVAEQTDNSSLDSESENIDDKLEDIDKELDIDIELDINKELDIDKEIYIDKELDTDDDVEIIENKKECIVVDDEDEEMKTDEDTDAPKCISCKEGIKSNVLECMRCHKEAHPTCTSKNELEETVCLPCHEILMRISALNKRKEEYVTLLEDMTILKVE